METFISITILTTIILVAILAAIGEGSPQYVDLFFPPAYA